MQKKRSFENAALILFLIIYEALCYALIVVRKPLTGDEHHFYRTVLEFSSDLSIDQILNYNELVTPLTFIVYGFYAKLAGTDLQTVRTLSLIIGFCTHFLFFRFLKEIFKSKLICWAVFLIWVLNPYILGFSGLVFTDGLSIFLIIVFLFSFYRKNYTLILFSSALLLYTRQFNLIIIVAAGFGVIFSALKFQKLNLKMLLSLVWGTAAVLPLFAAWRGFSPVGAMTEKLDAVPFIFYAESLAVYTYCIFIFALPLSILVLWYGKISKFRWYMLIAATLFFYNIFPVAPSYIAVKDGFYTVGLYDKLVTAVFSMNFFKHLVLYLSFLLGSAVFYLFIKEFFVRNKDENRGSFNQFLVIYITIFLLGMMFNFQIWEKYFTQILPAALILAGKLLEKHLPELSDDIKRFRRLET